MSNRASIPSSECGHPRTRWTHNENADRSRHTRAASARAHSLSAFAPGAEPGDNVIDVQERARPRVPFDAAAVGAGWILSS